MKADVRIAKDTTANLLELTPGEASDQIVGLRFVAMVGRDGKLLHDLDGEIFKVNDDEHLIFVRRVTGPSSLDVKTMLMASVKFSTGVLEIKASHFIENSHRRLVLEVKRSKEEFDGHPTKS